eukprot:CAMPEP_0116852272 /NCGR_PEP_ID=MMETSP0418-20121206/17197_1 /TAXON_ID=1158023 /ORGANISM="Astrosyne radiata, Strain 13vi08-1A" /LENGTH=291 /DNA_ID=CAMNT_0004484409 /DNA_START=301 /DNA_END=1177 /DNA_ORIENTATION=+
MCSQECSDASRGRKCGRDIMKATSLWLLQQLGTSSDYPDSGEKAEEALLREMALAQKTHPELDLEPDPSCYNGVVRALASSSSTDPQSAVKAARVMDELWQKCLADEIPGGGPDLFAYCSLIHALGRNEDGRRAEAVLKEMWARHKEYPEMATKPSTRIYNAVIDAYAKSKDPENATRIFERLWSMYATGGRALRFAPNTFSYNALIDAWSKSARPEKAEAVLREMYKCQKTHPNLDIEPDRASFVGVINAWAKSNDPHAADNARRFVRTAEQRLMGMGNEQNNDDRKHQD